MTNDASGFYLFVGTTGDHKCYRTQDDGSDWVVADSGLKQSGHIAFWVAPRPARPTSHSCPYPKQRIVSVLDCGMSWRDFNVPNQSTMSFAFTDSFLIAGTEAGGTWRYPLRQLLTTVSGGTTGARNPLTFSLRQNFPNPFNPTTKISYEIPKVINVRLTVFDILGREVQTLVNESKQPGKYQAVFNATNLASGVYLYRLQAGNFVETRKLLLLR